MGAYLGEPGLMHFLAGLEFTSIGFDPAFFASVLRAFVERLGRSQMQDMDLQMRDSFVHVRAAC
ncbi:hypothetical protein CJ010_21760 [Azoarcus sp. DD4]|nr:hypothetical protein CJ010_21760 [Azoarcus sp. DD4]